MDARIDGELEAHRGDNETFVRELYRIVLRRPPEPEAFDRAVTRLADGTLSRATLLHELATADEHRRVRELDDAVARGLAARRQHEPLRWLTGPAGTDERVIEIPWVLSRLASGSVLEVGYAFAEPAYLAGLLRAAPERLVGLDRATRDVEGMETVVADVRDTPFDDCTFDQILLVSTIEHVGADNAEYGQNEVADAAARPQALKELRRILRREGTLLATAPLGEPGDHGWFRQDDVRGWTRLFTRSGFFVEEQESYVLDEDGWRAEPRFRPEGVRYGERGPAAGAVLCTTLSPARLRRRLSPDGLARSARRRLRPVAHVGRG